MSLIHAIACFFVCFRYMFGVTFLREAEPVYASSLGYTVKPTSFWWTSVPRWIQIASDKYKHTYTVKPLYNDHVYSQPRVTLIWIWCWKKPKVYIIVTFVWNTPSLYHFFYLKHRQDNTEATVKRKIQSRNWGIVTSCMEQQY